MSELVWWPHKGYGRQLPDRSNVVSYDESYLEKCREREITDVGVRLIRARMATIVGNTRDNEVTVDVGVGALGLLRTLARHNWPVRGYDVNKKAVEALKEAGLFVDVMTTQVDNVCCWDSLEHMLSPEAMLKNVRQKVLMSIPIFDSAEHVIRSKHYKPGEHIWYFTEAGLLRWMREQGFGLIERNRDEERYGREGIGTYVFARQ